MAVDVKWDIRRDGRAWTGDEARRRWELTPEKFEMYLDQAVRLGDPEVWREAIAELR
jgi:hypothetical protein